MILPLIIGCGVLLVIVVIAVSQRPGPRITTIETRRDVDKEEDDDA